MHELSELFDSVHTITFENIPEMDSDDILSHEEKVDIVNTIIQLMYDYTTENADQIHEPSYHEDMMEAVEELIQDSIDGASWCGDGVDIDVDDDYMVELVLYAVEMFYIQVMPKRSYYKEYESMNTNGIGIFPCHTDRRTLTATLKHLKDIPQPEQRTMEWHIYRHGLITASNAYKALDSECARNQLIYEKCKPITMDAHMPSVSGGIPVANYPGLDIVKNANSDEQQNRINTDICLSVNITTPMHWGQKYEPVSTMYYEMLNSIKVGEYGCIPHEKYKFLGASPDGIVETRDSELYGRMLEIKNIVNRDITGIPLKAYWVQMQLQMEVCGLDTCDFLETRFVEYANKTDFDADGTFFQTHTDMSNPVPKGIMLFFINKEYLPVYEYKPLQMNRREYEMTWLPNIIKKHAELGHHHAHTYYWKLAEVSCVLVLRNKLWFELNVPKLASTWNTILAERKSGYSHRAPKKRVGASKDSDNVFNQCLLNTDAFRVKVTKQESDNFGDSDTDTVSTSDDRDGDDIIELNSPCLQPPIPSTHIISPGTVRMIMHIRTESIDETTI